MYKEKYQKWLKNAAEYKTELESISGDEKEIEDRFYQDLEFGTGGLRGKMGAGTNRLNIYTVRKATAGLAELIVSKGDYAKERGVAICFDNRNHSTEFAKECADVLAAYNINVYIYDTLRPTPVCSFTVRHLYTIAGIMITASHNTKEYNGYKCYWEDGGQMPPTESDALLNIIEKMDEFNIKSPTEEQKNKYIHTIGKEVDEAYISTVLKQSIRQGGDLNITYTPLYGTGNLPIREVLSRSGFNNIHLVEEQITPNGDFPTAPYPNPEKDECWKEALKTAENNNSDIIIASDPDADRTGVIARNSNGVLKKFTGNQVGNMLTHYVLSNKILPENPAIITTIVSSRLTKRIAAAHNVEYFDVYTGFKYIAEKILEFEGNNSHNFVMGWEESIGYLVGDYARDKDAVVASMLICQMAQECKDNGKTLWDFLDEVYAKYGFLYEKTVDLVKEEGINGTQEITSIMENFRSNTPSTIGGVKVSNFIDYKKNIKPANVISFQLENGSEVCVRPSGTEPKIKFYFSCKDEAEFEAMKEILE